MAFRLIDLPREIRNTIYSTLIPARLRCRAHTWAMNGDVRDEKRVRYNLEGLEVNSWETFCHIRLACKQSNKEAVEQLHSGTQTGQCVLSLDIVNHPLDGYEWSTETVPEMPVDLKHCIPDILLGYFSTVDIKMPYVFVDLDLASSGRQDWEEQNVQLAAVALTIIDDAKSNDDPCDWTIKEITWTTLYDDGFKRQDVARRQLERTLRRIVWSKLEAGLTGKAMAKLQGALVDVPEDAGFDDWKMREWEYGLNIVRHGIDDGIILNEENDEMGREIFKITTETNEALVPLSQ